MQRNHLTPFILILGLAVVPGTLLGATFQVTTSEALLSALYDAATNGENDTIRVAQGTYDGSYVYSSTGGQQPDHRRGLERRFH